MQERKKKTKKEWKNGPREVRKKGNKCAKEEGNDQCTSKEDENKERHE